MKKLITLSVVVAFMSFGLIFMSCDNAETLQNLYEIADNTEGLESLVVLITFVEENAETSPGIVEGFSDTTLTATAFAPNNAAFEALFSITGILTASDISDFADSYGATDEEIADYFAEIIGLHVIVDQKLLKADIIADADGVIGPTEYDDVVIINLEVSVDGETITLTPDVEGSTSADIVTADIEASNGVAHIVDAVMMPPIPE